MSSLPPSGPLTLELSDSSTVIVSPQRGAYQAICERLSAALSVPNTIDDAADPESLGAGPVIVLGNLMDCRLVRKLYLESYDCTDLSWPSIGGSVLRTVRDPLGTGAHVLLVGGSDAEGVASAAGQLESIVECEGPRLGYLNRVKLGRLADQIHRYTQKFLSDDAETWERVGGAGSWHYERAIARAGLGYLRTGDEAYLPRFLDEFRHFAANDLRNPRLDQPQVVHGFLHLILLVWDLVRDHPFFDDATRRQIDEDFLYILHDPAEGPQHLREDTLTWVVRDNHATMSALDAYFGGRFFWRRFRHEPALDWLELAARYFAPQLASSKPIGDHWGHQWAFSLYNTLVYAMATGNEDYCRGPHLKGAADRALIAHPSECQPHGYLNACAVATGDSGYGSGAGSPDERAARGASMGKVSPGGFGECFEIIRSFCTGEPADPRTDLLGVAEAPVDDLWNDTIAERGFNPDYVFACTSARDERFDKISLREGWASDDFYLLVDGISGGHHSYVDANCIKFLCERGVSWLGLDATKPSLAETLCQVTSVAIENGVSAVLDGAGPGRLHRYARRLYTADTAQYLAVGAALGRLGRVCWHRHILRRRGAWTLVVDVVAPREAGELLARRTWHVDGEVESTADGLHSRGGNGDATVCFHLQSAGIAREPECPAAHPVETLRMRVEAGAAVAFASLLHVTDTEVPAFRLEAEGATWRVRTAGAEDEVTVRATQEGIEVSDGSEIERFGQLAGPFIAPAPPPRADPNRKTRRAAQGPPWRTIDTGGGAITAVAADDAGRVACGDDAGRVQLFDARGERVFRSDHESPISALHLVEDRVIVGEQRGALTCLGADGTARWQHLIEYEVRNWSYMSEKSTRIREIGSRAAVGDGGHGLVVFCADRLVYAFDSSGRRQWQKVITTGIPTAMTVGPCEGRTAIYGGTSMPSVHGWCLIFAPEDGAMRWYARDDLLVWSLRCRICDTRLADVDGDGRLEMINGVDSACRQLIAYRQGGGVLWDADVAGGALCVAVMPAPGNASGAAMVACGSATGWVSAHEGKTGRRMWQCPVGQPTVFLGRFEANRMIAVTEKGQCFVIGSDGSLGDEVELSAPVTAVLRPGDHRAGSIVPLGTASGQLLVLDGQRAPGAMV